MWFIWRPRHPIRPDPSLVTGEALTESVTVTQVRVPGTTIVRNTRQRRRSARDGLN
jgi:hypothetical protein